MQKFLLSTVVFLLFCGILMVPTACNEDLDFEEIEEEIEEYDIDLAVKLSLDKLSYTVTAIGNIEEKRGRNKSIITEHGFYYGYAQVYDESNYERDYTKIKSNEPVNEFSFEIPADMEKQSSVFCCVVYAKTEKGIFFSAIRSVFLWSDAEVEVEISSNFTDLTFERATVYASCSVIDEARFPITERGFCYINTHLIKGENPTISDDYIVVEGTGSGKFSATIKGLKPAAAYKVRAYARNIAGITYSRSYVTLPMYSSESFIPEVIAKSDRKNPNVLEGNVYNDHEYIITEKGFCYNVGGSTPTINDTKIVLGEGIGSFYFDTSELPAGSYFFRAYAINEAGCGYSGIPIELNIP